MGKNDEFRYFVQKIGAKVWVKNATKSNFLNVLGQKIILEWCGLVYFIAY